MIPVSTQPWLVIAVSPSRIVLSIAVIHPHSQTSFNITLGEKADCHSLAPACPRALGPHCSRGA